MFRTNNCGELRSRNTGEKVTLAGWVKRSRNLGGMTFIDLRDRYGVTQIAFNMEVNAELCEKARKTGREFVIQVSGEVMERSSKNKDLPTGDIEIKAESLQILSTAETPPFTIENDTDGGEELRMKYRYLDLRRDPLQRNLALRHKLALETRKFLDEQGFLEIETPYLIKSTPEGARDFVVPSRMHENQFYALPQSPQIFKQLLMVSGYDKYFQIVRCFRDEDLRADRQPEFTQIDCEMSFVEREDVLQTFEKLARHLLSSTIEVELPEFKRMPYAEAMEKYGSDKPDLRFNMPIHDLTSEMKGADFKVFDNAPYIAGINASGCAGYSRKDLDKLTDFVKRPQIGAKGMVWVKYNEDGSIKSAIDKFYGQDDLRERLAKTNAQPGDLVLILSGDKKPMQKALGELRLEMGNRLNLRKPDDFAPLWVVDFPMFERDDETGQLHAMHHPFTSPVAGHESLLRSEPEKALANAYDMVINGVEIGGGSIRIHDRDTQKTVFEALNFTDEEAQKQFGFLMDAFKYGAPPHGGIAFGFDRLAALTAGKDSIRDFIAFPKNNAGRDLMIDAPATIAHEQWNELRLKPIDDEK